ncbi:MAG: pentapeptide repeat-containing protein [Deltaproteobacteria bacterium]|nr:pentapeptide repeat-containing protein [Deltaproteobacteria bacterium]
MRRDRARRHRPSLPVLAFGLWLAAALVGGCGDDGMGAAPVEGPLPNGADDAQAYTERFLAGNPRALLPPDLLAVVDLEATGETDGDTCDTQDGVDCLPYVFDADTRLTLSTDDAPVELERLVLRDAAGAVVLAQAAGSPPSSATIAAGAYVLELRHRFAGDRGAATRTIFLQPSAPPAEAAVQAGSTDGVAAQTAPRTIEISATRDCIGCNFSKARLVEQHFDGLTLSGAVFDGAEMNNTTFRGAVMDGCSLQKLAVYPTFRQLNATNAEDRDADFSGATLSGSTFSVLIFPGRGPFTASFRDATLDHTVWEFAGGDQHVCIGEGFNAFCGFLSPDFRNADLRQARFTRVEFRSRYGRVGCSFQGADLTGADFRAAQPRNYFRLGPCRFDREPESGRVTILRDANLSHVVAHGVLGGAGVTFSEADLRGAVLEGAHLGMPDNGHPQGASFARANLSGARLAGATIAGVNFTGATLTGLIPSTFNGVDLTLTNFAEVNLAGFDLSRTDFSRAASFRGGAPRFIGATLSDGTRGVNLAGQVFPSLYSGLKGTDLTGATLTGAELPEADLEGVTLINARMVGANLNFANLRRAKMIAATLGVAPGSEIAAGSLRGALMTDVDLSDADLRSVDLTSAHLYGDTAFTKLIRTRLDSANFSHAICSQVHFSGTMNNAVFTGAQLVNAVFNGATLTNAKFSDAYLQGADFANATGTTGTGLSNAAVAAAAGTWSFTEQDGTPFVVRYEATKLGRLATDPSVVCPDGTRGPCCPNGDLAACLNAKLKPVRNGPHPPIPPCVPKAPRYDNCITPRPTATPRPTPTPVRP